MKTINRIINFVKCVWVVRDLFDKYGWKKDLKSCWLVAKAGTDFTNKFIKDYKLI